jgi:hypothetical protein
VTDDGQECTDPPGLSGPARKIKQLQSAPFKSKKAQRVKLAE